MHVQDRIRELRRVPAAQLRPNPRNWRTHPTEQQDAMRGVLAEIGYADALIARELDNGALELIDGHLRAETTPDMLVPVLIVDLSAEEATKLLVLHDPLAAMAETNQALLDELLGEVDTQHTALRALLDTMAQPAPPNVNDEPAEIDLKPLFQVLVECADESEQQAVYEQLKADGRSCRLLTI